MTMQSVDFVVGEIAKRYDVLLDPDDPSLLVVEIHRLMFSDLLHDIQEARADFLNTTTDLLGQIESSNKSTRSAIGAHARAIAESDESKISASMELAKQLQGVSRMLTSMREEVKPSSLKPHVWVGSGIVIGALLTTAAAFLFSR